MKMKQPLDYKVIFDDYMKAAFQIEIDLRFWKHFMQMSIDNYQKDNPDNRWINESGFGIYNIPEDTRSGRLAMSDKTFTIEINDLLEHNNNFFIWIMNLSLARIYTCVELLLIQTIQHKFFPLLESPIKGKKEMNKIIKAVKDEIVKAGEQLDTKNNRHLIAFLKMKSATYKLFLAKPQNIDLNTNWEAFYEFFSVIRNIVAHEEMMVSGNTRNTLNSIASDVYRRYFHQPNNNKTTEPLKPKDGDAFLNLISRVNDFAVNTVKFIAEENNLSFIGLH